MPLPNNPWNQIAPIARRLVKDRNTVLFDEGDPAARLYRVESGGVKLSKSLPDGRTQILRFCLPGEIFGISVGIPHHHRAEPVCPTALAVVEYSRLWDMADRDQPWVRMWLLTLIRQDLHDTQAHLVHVGQMTAEERIYAFLLRHASPATGRVRLPMQWAEVADHLGLKPETASRVLGRFEKRGLLQRQSRDALTLLARDPEIDHTLAA